MRLLISYDIVDDNRRTASAHALEDHGIRVQYSVFECDLEEAQLIALTRRLGEIIDRETDSVRIYRLCGRCVSAFELIGTGRHQLPERVQVL